MWGELASHKRSSTHRPRHPGVLFFVVGLFFGCQWFVLGLLDNCLSAWVGWLGVFSFLFSLPSNWCAMHLYIHAKGNKRSMQPKHCITTNLELQISWCVGQC